MKKSLLKKLKKFLKIYENDLKLYAEKNKLLFIASDDDF